MDLLGDLDKTVSVGGVAEVLPIFKDNNQNFQLMQSKWASQLNPLLQVPLTSGQLLSNQTLVSGLNVINHGLGKVLEGWIIVRKRQWSLAGVPTVYDVSDLQDQNSMPALTLELYSTQGTSSNPVLVDLWVY